MNVPGNVLIRGGGFRNKGAEAMVLTVVKEMRRRLPGSRFFCEVAVDQRARAEAEGCFPLPRRLGGRMRKACRLGLAMVLHPRMARLVKMGPRTVFGVFECRPLGAVVDVSGFAYGDDWGTGASANTLRLQAVCATQGIPYVFAPQAWGPFVTSVLAEQVRAMCDAAALVGVRDETSLRYLTDLLGSGANGLSETPDLAFLFESAPAEIGRQLLEDAGLKPGEQPIVGFTPNARAFERSAGEGASNAYLMGLGEAAQRLLEQGCALALIAHEGGNGRPEGVSDPRLCMLLRGMLPADAPVALFGGDLSAAILKSIISNLDLLVASRYHSIVAAVSACVPVVSVGWSHKYQGLMRDAHLEDYALEANAASAADLGAKVIAALQNRTSLRTTLNQTVPGLKRAASAFLDDVACLVKERQA